MTARRPTRRTDDGLATRLAWITGLRLGFLTLLLGATAFFYLRGALAQLPAQPCASSSSRSARRSRSRAIYAVVLRERQAASARSPTRRSSSISSRGRRSSTSRAARRAARPRSTALTCLVGAILVGLRGAAIAAVSGIARLRGCCARRSRSRWIRPPRDQAAANYVVDVGRASSTRSLVNALGIVVVALLAGYLAERLRRTGGALAEAQRARADGRAARACSDGSPPGSRTRSETRSARSPARSRCCARRPALSRRGQAALRHRPARGRAPERSRRAT